MSQFLYLSFMYFNGMKPLVDFRLTERTPLVVLKSKVDNILHYPYNIRVVKIEYQLPSIDSKGNMKFNNFELKRDEDLRFMWSTYH